MNENTTDAANRGAARGLSRAQTLMVAAAAGMSVANIYYAQPLLDLMANDLGISPSRTGLVITLTQVGYGLGLIFIVPIGDLIDRRKLIIVQGLLSAIALVVVATARAKTTVFAGMGAVGLLAVLVQTLVSSGHPGTTGVLVVDLVKVQFYQAIVSLISFHHDLGCPMTVVMQDDPTP